MVRSCGQACRAAARAALLLALGLLAGAGGRVRATTVSSVTLTLRFAAWSSDAGAVGLGPAVRPTDATSVEEAWLGVEQLRFRDVGTCRKQGGRVDVKGPVIAELVRGAAYGLPSAITLRKGRYCGFEAALRAMGAGPSEAPADGRGFSVILRGSRADGVRFLLRSRRTGPLRLRARDPEGFALLEDSASVVLAADAARWMRGVDLTTAEVEGHGASRIIRIDERANAPLLAAFEQSFPAALYLFRDRDGDGALSPEERATEGALAGPWEETGPRADRPATRRW